MVFMRMLYVDVFVWILCVDGCVELCVCVCCVSRRMICLCVDGVYGWVCRCIGESM